MSDALLIILLLVVGAAAVLSFSNWIGVLCAERFVSKERRIPMKREPKKQE